jgi:hypothetical protein
MLVFRSEWARKYWSVMVMSGHVNVDPLWVCVNVGDCCDPSSIGTLTTINHGDECVLPSTTRMLLYLTKFSFDEDVYVTPCVSNPYDYVDHVFKRP